MSWNASPQVALSLACLPGKALFASLRAPAPSSCRLETLKSLLLSLVASLLKMLRILEDSGTHWAWSLGSRASFSLLYGESGLWNLYYLLWIVFASHWSFDIDIRNRRECLGQPIMESFLVWAAAIITMICLHVTTMQKLWKSHICIASAVYVTVLPLPGHIRYLVWWYLVKATRSFLSSY